MTSFTLHCGEFQEMPLASKEDPEGTPERGILNLRTPASIPSDYCGRSKLHPRPLLDLQLEAWALT